MDHLYNDFHIKWLFLSGERNHGIIHTRKSENNNVEEKLYKNRKLIVIGTRWEWTDRSHLQNMLRNGIILCFLSVQDTLHRYAEEQKPK